MAFKIKTLWLGAMSFATDDDSDSVAPQSTVSSLVSSDTDDSALDRLSLTTQKQQRSLGSPKQRRSATPFRRPQLNCRVENEMSLVIPDTMRNFHSGKGGDEFISKAVNDSATILEFDELQCGHRIDRIDGDCTTCSKFHIYSTAPEEFKQTRQLQARRSLLELDQSSQNWELETRLRLHCPSMASILTEEAVLQGCRNCIRYIAWRVVTHSLQSRVTGLKRIEDKIYGNPIPFVKHLTGFPGVLLGFDRKGYCYVRNLSIARSGAYNSAYRMMSLQMAHFYSEMNPLSYELIMDIEDIKISEHLIAECFRGVFYRVQVVNCDKDANSVLVVDVDSGRYFDVEGVQLFRIRRRFLVLPFKVMRCKLFDLECFLESGAMREVSKTLPRFRSLWMSVIKMDTTPTLVILPEHSTVTLNTMIREAIREFNPFPNTYFRGTSVGGGVITHISRSGYFWYKIKSGITEFLENLRPTKPLKVDSQTTLEMISNGKKLFVARYCGKYLRVQLVREDVPQNLVVVTLMDSGIVDIIQVDNLIPVTHFDKIVTEIPAQCKMFSLGSDVGFVQETIREKYHVEQDVSCQMIHGLLVIEGVPEVLTRTFAKGREMKSPKPDVDYFSS